MVVSKDQLHVELHRRNIFRLVIMSAFVDFILAEIGVHPGVDDVLIVDRNDAAELAQDLVGLIGPKLRFWPSCGTSVEHHGLPWACSNMATFSAVNLKPRRSGMRSAEIGYRGISRICSCNGRAGSELSAASDNMAAIRRPWPLAIPAPPSQSHGPRPRSA